MTTKQIGLLASYLNGLLQEYREGSKGDSYNYNGEALSQIRNILYSNISSVHQKSLELIGGYSASQKPWTRIKDTLLKKPQYHSKNYKGYNYPTSREACIYECGCAICAKLSRLPLIIGKYDHNPNATAILEWRLRNQV